MVTTIQKKSKAKSTKQSKKTIEKPTKKNKGIKKAAAAAIKKKTKKPSKKEEESSDDEDVFKKLQQIMDEDSEASENVSDDDDALDSKSAFLSEDDIDQDTEMEDSDVKEEEDDEEENDDDETVDRLNKDIDQHKKDLEELKERDPEFYEYLKKENDGLLDFNESDEEEREQDEEESDVEDKQAAIPVLTKDRLNEWIQKINATKDFRAFKSLLSAFKTAARMSEEDDKITFTIKIDDPNVFSKVIITTLRCAPTVFLHYLKAKKEGDSPMKSGRWNFYKSYVKSYLTNLIHLLRNLTDADMLRLTVKEAEKCTVLLVCFDRLAKEYLKTLLNLWSSSMSSDSVRIQSFLAIKSLAIASVPSGKESKAQGYLDMCLKNVYLTFVKHCKNTNPHTLPVINLMRNLATQLYGINMTLSYQQAFVYIRQLAIHLRAAMKNRTVKDQNMVYNWQYIHCIDFWADVLNAYAGPMKDEEGDEVESPLKSLVYPLTQVAMGTIQLIPTAQYYPLRFHVLRCLTSLVHNTNTYIPLTVYVIEVLQGAVAMEKAKKTGGVPLDWDTVLKVHKKIIHGRMYQDDVLDQCAKALKNYYKEYYENVAFPEMVDTDIVAIRRFLKHSKSLKGKEKLLNLVREVMNTRLAVLD
ncbi:Noc2-domain-containing protein [Rhizopus microsporus ATCC 52813]|uniref:Noc2-domain-containing protein n=1 Tax=Rhizopus microsporus ATCC 52813 TaxID=1340429 RepID=A0A2G4SG49_RHIZD|nr:Noc2-domain-containing protein [Rhizopus microsporus ATCC 52813]PHZ07744.1 Noc2-domain-containing protein [Rhizopus microsporus ATCC 52813]